MKIKRKHTHFEGIMLMTVPLYYLIMKVFTTGPDKREWLFWIVIPILAVVWIMLNFKIHRSRWVPLSEINTKLDAININKLMTTHKSHPTLPFCQVQNDPESEKVITQCSRFDFRDEYDEDSDSYITCKYAFTSYNEGYCLCHHKR